MFELKSGSAEEAQSIVTNMVEAQRWCNFTLLKPTWLPEDIEPGDYSLRPEQPNDQSSSFRMVGRGASRTFTLKQFLFDFAPPAYDHPALWRNPKKTAEDEFPDPVPHLIGDNVLWIGRDHRRFPAATIGYRRVRVELTVTEGGFSNSELIKLFEGLVPADPDYAAVLDQTAFAELSYQRRHPRLATPVPLSYWTHKRHDNHHHRARLISEMEPPFALPDFKSLGYELDSLFSIESENGRLEEVDFIYEAKARNGAYLRLLLTPPSSMQPIPFPPEKYTQSCQIEKLANENQTVHLAWLEDGVGPYELSFQIDGWNVILLVQPAKWTNRTFVNELLKRLL